MANNTKGPHNYNKKNLPKNLLYKRVTTLIALLIILLFINLSLIVLLLVDLKEQQKIVSPKKITPLKIYPELTTLPKPSLEYPVDEEMYQEETQPIYLERKEKEEKEEKKEDDDKDGVPNEEDNCPDTPNPSQEDSDNDLIGDACDSCPYDYNNDIDEDGICGDQDNCPFVYNPDQLDSNNNGIGDACEIPEIPGEETKNKSTRIYFSPTELMLSENKNFSLPLFISTEKKIYAFEIIIDFNSSVLEVTGVEEGDFLSRGTTTSWNFCCQSIDNEEGKLIISNSRIGVTEGVSGNGSLFIINGTVSKGISEMNFFSVTLLDENDNTVPLEEIELEKAKIVVQHNSTNSSNEAL